MSKNHPKSPPASLFSGAMSATLRESLPRGVAPHAFPEQCRPITKLKELGANPFRSNVGHPHVELPNFASNNTGKAIWQEQSLT